MRLEVIGGGDNTSKIGFQGIEDAEMATASQSFSIIEGSCVVKDLRR